MSANGMPESGEGGLRRCEHRFLGRVAYADAARLQERLVAGLRADQGGEHLLFLEHPHVVTLGRGADRANILLDEATRAARGIGIHETGRGGDVTYHGPGQLVGYPIIDLKPDRCDIHGYVRDLEEVLIRTAADFDVVAGRVAGLTGIWVGDRKLAAIGVRITRWVTSHGFAFNVATDLSYFDHIIPCGIMGRGVTSLLAETGRAPGLEEVSASAARHFGDVYGREMVPGAAAWNLTVMAGAIPAAGALR
jgi:lipoyl(octanoyl) transferase